MAPNVKNHAANSEDFETRYGDLVAREFPDFTTAYTLKRALASRVPPIIISEGILKNWFDKYRLPAGAVKVADAAALQDQCGAILPALAARTSRVSDIMRELKTMTPSVHASHNVITRWLRIYFGLSDLHCWRLGTEMGRPSPRASRGNWADGCS